MQATISMRVLVWEFHAVVLLECVHSYPWALNAHNFKFPISKSNNEMTMNACAMYANFKQNILRFPPCSLWGALAVTEARHNDDII